MKNEETLKKKGKKSRYSKPKFLITFCLVMGLFAAIRYGFAIEVPIDVEASQPNEDEYVAYLVGEEVIPEKELIELPKEEPEEEGDAKEDSAIEEPILYDAEPDSMPFDHSHHETIVNEPEDNLLIEHPINDPAHPKNPHRIRGVRSYADCFPDIQDIQILAAQRYGIQPVRTRKEAEKLVKRHKLVNICHSPFYTVDDLTHSIPYLVPRAQQLLNTICLNFLDSCQVKGLPPHLPMITSVLRTTDDVSNLQRGNKNATTNSCHCYGTTVDIAYNRFMPVTGTYESNAALLRWNEPMKQVLAEVLYDLRQQQKCYVKYERKQGCFHLTCR